MKQILAKRIQQLSNDLKVVSGDDKKEIEHRVNEAQKKLNLIKAREAATGLQWGI